jgi:hypothetical protein
VSSAVWLKSFGEGATSSGATAFVTIDLADYLVDPVTVRRVIIDWEYALINTSTAFPVPSQVPVGLGVGLSVATPPAAPLPPSAGPLSDKAQYPWWWQGDAFEPVYVPAVGNSWWGGKGRIDFTINHKLDPALNSSIFFGVEVDDPATSFFDVWSAVAYSQVLSYPSL